MYKNKGFVMSTYVYMLLVFFLLILGTLLLVLNNSKMLANKSRMGVQNRLIFELNGSSDIYVFKDTEFKDIGVNATTPSGKDLTNSVKVSSNVDTSELGDYTVTYQINYNGMDKSLTRNVHVVEDVIDFAYTGSSQSFIVPTDGYYFVELWGAQGGSMSTYTTLEGGNGGYTSGLIYLNANEMLYIYVGGKGESVRNTALNSTAHNLANGGYNGGKSIYSEEGSGANASSGGGATDIRYFGSTTPTLSDLEWNSTLGLNSRIMVAGGGGGSDLTDTEKYSGHGGAGGSLIASAGTNIVDGENTTHYGLGGAQIREGSNGDNSTNMYNEIYYSNAGAGGGGYYSGGNGAGYRSGGGGGSSFISGYAGVNAITSSTDRTHTNNTMHYSNKYFIDGKMISGTNSGNGKAKITYIGDEPTRKNGKLDGVRYIKDCINGNTENNDNHWAEIEAIKDGINIAKDKTVTGTSAAYNQSGNNHSYSYITDGIIDNIDSSNGYKYSMSTETGLQCVTVDLGALYDLDEIATWHYYPDDRTYNNHTLSVSRNNSTWTLLISNTEAETSNGKRVSAYEYFSSPTKLTVNYIVTTTDMRIGQAIPSTLTPTGVAPRSTASAAINDWKLITGDNSTRPFYIKHTIENDIITESYVEFVVTEEMAAANEGMVAGTYTLRGGDGGTAFTDNMNAIKTAFDYANHSDRCGGNQTSGFYCRVGGLYATATSGGGVLANDRGSHGCRVYLDGGVICL